MSNLNGDLTGEVSDLVVAFREGSLDTSITNIVEHSIIAAFLEMRTCSIELVMNVTRQVCAKLRVSFEAETVSQLYTTLVQDVRAQMEKDDMLPVTKTASVYQPAPSTSHDMLHHPADYVRTAYTFLKNQVQSGTLIQPCTIAKTCVLHAQASGQTTDRFALTESAKEIAQSLHIEDDVDWLSLIRDAMDALSSVQKTEVRFSEPMTTDVSPEEAEYLFGTAQNTRFRAIFYSHYSIDDDLSPEEWATLQYSQRSQFWNVPLHPSENFSHDDDPPWIIEPSESDVDPRDPCEYEPGTEGKMQKLSERYDAGLPLWHGNDLPLEIHKNEPELIAKLLKNAQEVGDATRKNISEAAKLISNEFPSAA